MSLATDVATIIIAGGTLVVAYFALMVSKSATRAQENQSKYQTKQYELNSIMQIHQLLSTPEARAMRRRVYGRHEALKGGIPGSSREEDEIAAITGDIDIIGSLIEDGLVSKNAFLKMYSGMICNTWEILGPLIKKERDVRHEPIYKHYFEELAGDAKAYREKNGWPVITLRSPWNPENMPEFLLEKFKERTEKPVISNLTLRIKCVKGTVEKCTVWVGGVQAFSERGNEAVIVRTFAQGEALNFRIPYTLNPNKTASVEIKDSDQVVFRRMWDDIIWGAP